MAQVPVSPAVLVILDGWGYREHQDANAIALSKTPVMDSLWAAYPHTLIQASGKAVGLPEGQMGNSEVGHLNIGAGRVVPQELVRISDAVEDGSILENPALMEVCQQVRDRQTKLHLIGLCSPGGVHSHISHLLGLLDLAKVNGVPQVCVHVITDGRDTDPKSGLASVLELEAHMQRVGIGQIVTISGRYYAMDRDRRWDRIQAAYTTITSDAEIKNSTAADYLRCAYAEGITDEFLKPCRIAPGAVAAGDGVIFFNFRPDRARELTQAFVDSEFNGFERPQITPLSFVTFTQYDPKFPVLVAFAPQDLTKILGEVISERGLRQLRAAETEKYAHVTYFFNGGLENPFPGEDRQLVQSPMVSTYDQAPAMAAAEVTKVVTGAIASRQYSLIVVNYANPDMVGHTGNIAATIAAVETVDRCVGELVAAVNQVGGTVVITADHGNAEYMADANGNPWTAHTTNPVPLILVEGEGLKLPGHGNDITLRSDGRLADIAPTLLEILQIPKPPEMTGQSLVVPSGINIQTSRTPVRISL
jgi:2,3-bisphosphoglycerate-independent phosphoglycerate mutase